MAAREDTRHGTRRKRSAVLIGIALALVLVASGCRLGDFEAERDYIGTSGFTDPEGSVTIEFSYGASRDIATVIRLNGLNPDRDWGDEAQTARLIQNRASNLIANQISSYAAQAFGTSSECLGRWMEQVDPQALGCAARHWPYHLLEAIHSPSSAVSQDLLATALAIRVSDHESTGNCLRFRMTFAAGGPGAITSDGAWAIVDCGSGNSGYPAGWSASTAYSLIR